MEEFDEWWPAYIQSPTYYYHLARRQTQHNILMQHKYRWGYLHRLAARACSLCELENPVLLPLGSFCRVNN